MLSSIWNENVEAQNQAASPSEDSEIESVCQLVAQKDYCFLPADRSRKLLQTIDQNALADWPSFQDSWSNLALDGYMADGGKYRYRRHATLSALPSSRRFQVQPHQPHFQSLTYNHLNGGVARHFEPVGREVMEGGSFQSLVTLGCEIFGRLAPYSSWHIEVHQFRIESTSDLPGSPTPEGVHRDGVNFVLMALVRRTNLLDGVTSIYAPDRTWLDEFTLWEPLDMAIVNDERVLHGVTPVLQLDVDKPGVRDMLVITFRRKC